MKTMTKENCVPFSHFNVYVNVIIYYTEIHLFLFLFLGGGWYSVVKLIGECMVVFVYSFFITHTYRTLSIVFSMDIWGISWFEHHKYSYYEQYCPLSAVCAYRNFCRTHSRIEVAGV